MKSFGRWLDMEKERLKAISLVIAIVLGHYQGFNLIEKIEKLNKTMIELVQNDKFKDKEIKRLEKRIDDNAKLLLEIVKSKSSSK